MRRAGWPKNIVAAGLARQCEVQLAYAIGVAKPVSILVNTYGTGTVADDKIEAAVEKVFDLRPAAIIRDLDLRKTHLPPAGGLRAHGARGTGRALGSHRPRRRAQSRAGVTFRSAIQTKAQGFALRFFGLQTGGVGV